MQAVQCDRPPREELPGVCDGDRPSRRTAATDTEEPEAGEPPNAGEQEAQCTGVTGGQQPCGDGRDPGLDQRGAALLGEAEGQTALAKSKAAQHRALTGEKAD